MLTFAVVFPFLVALVCAFAARYLGRRTGFLAVLGFIPALSLIPMLTGMPTAQPVTELIPWVSELELHFGFRGDGFSLLFAVLIGVVGTLATAYSVSYLSDQEKFGRFYPYLLSFGGSMLGLVLSDNLPAMFMFWEMTSITSFLLIGLWHTKGAARDGAVKAFLVSALGGLSLLAAVIMVSIGGGSTFLSQIDIAALEQSVFFIPALLCTIFAAATKSSQIPFHLWLPTAMEAPTPISAFLHSATMVKAGVLLIAKFGLLFASAALWHQILVPLGLATMFWGSWLALRQIDLKALLAYSTISQLGLLMSLYGLSTEEARFAATSHLLNHAAFKAALFFIVGIIDHETGTRDILYLTNLRKKLPITFALALIATLSMAGLPPLGGFISKELFYEQMLHHGWTYITVAVLGSMLTFAYCGRLLSIFFPSFWKLPSFVEEQRDEVMNGHIHEAGPPLYLPPLILVCSTILFGIWPISNEWLTKTASASLHYEEYHEHLALWHGFNIPLLLSIITWIGGGLLIWKSQIVNQWQLLSTPQWNANTVYYQITEGAKNISIAIINKTQGLKLPDQLRIMILAAGMMAAYALWKAPQVFKPISQLPVAVIPVAILLIAGAIGVLVSRNRMTLIIIMGLTGFGSAAFFLSFSAPDLALTQLLVETVTVILFLLVFRYLPRVRDMPRQGFRLVLDITLAVSAGIGATLLTLASTRFLAPPISPWYIANSYKGGGGKNVVNVLLVDFRGFDTLGESLVVGMVALAIASLVKLGRHSPLPEEIDTREEKKE